MGVGMKLRVTITTALAVAAVAAVPAGASAAEGCDVTVAPGNDPKAAVEQLTPGQTLCFAAGVHAWSDSLSVRTPNVTLMPEPGADATLKGYLRVEVEGKGSVIEGLTLDGRNPDNLFNPMIYADRVTLRGNEITNHHTTNCVHLAPYYDDPAPAGVVIEDNDIHDCGKLPANNHEHGIYIAAAKNTIIRNNRIWGNADRGIQLYTAVTGTEIYGNVIDGNGTGVIFGGAEGVMATDTTVEHNLITNSNVRHNIEASFDEQTTPATSNVVRDNCIFNAEGWYDEADGSGIQKPESGFTATDNLIADPGYANRKAGDFTLAPDSPCAGVLEGTAAAPAGRLELIPARTEVRPGALTKLRGRTPTGVSGQVTVLRKTRGNWKPFATASVRGRSFAVKARVRSLSRFKARAIGARDSKAVRVATRGQKVGR
jgi:parallel beta-helix repeat protein